jgi:hypothetical protein
LDGDGCCGTEGRILRSGEIDGEEGVPADSVDLTFRLPRGLSLDNYQHLEQKFDFARANGASPQSLKRE